MLDNPISWIGFIAMLPALFMLGRIATRAIINLFMDERVTISVKMLDGTRVYKRIRLNKDDDLDQLIKDVANSAKQTSAQTKA